jgi:purine-binding chemotaxis protein CheW
MKDEAGSDLSEAQRVLRVRAQALARPADSPPLVGRSLEVLEFSLAGEWYALEVSYVGGIEPLRNLAPLPCTPAFVAGLVNVRGRLLPVIDLKKFFDLTDKGLTDLHCVIVVRDRDVEFGVLADVIGSVRLIPVDSLEVALPTLTDIGAEFLKGVTPERLVVLDLARIFADPKIMVNEDVDD